MTESEEFFIAESIRHARLMSHAQCVKYLRGLSMFLSDDEMDIVTEEGASLRSIIRSILDFDAQLELISSKQSKFNFSQDREAKS